MSTSSDKTVQPINLLLENEFQLMDNVIAAALDNEPDIKVVGRATNIDDAMKLVQENDVGLALVSMRLPELGALNLTNAITDLATSTNVLALGQMEEKKRVLRYVEADATGNILAVSWNPLDTRKRFIVEF
jgi:DNA-binding NarL/FixJ family response regulator